MRQSTATATPPVIRGRLSALSTLQPVTAAEVTKLLKKAPAKHCRLDPVPTWLVKRATAQFAPILATLCNASFQAGSLPTSQKHALVSARLKKPQLDPADTNSYRPISQLSFASNLSSERWPHGLFNTAHRTVCCQPGCLPIVDTSPLKLPCSLSTMTSSERLTGVTLSP